VDIGQRAIYNNRQRAGSSKSDIQQQAESGQFQERYTTIGRERAVPRAIYNNTQIASSSKSDVQQ
jgi:hypothetical protein